MMKFFVGLVAVLLVAATQVDAETVVRTERAGGPVMKYTDGVLTHIDGVRVVAPAPVPAPVQVPARVVYVPSPRLAVRVEAGVSYRHYSSYSYYTPRRRYVEWGTRDCGVAWHVAGLKAPHKHIHHRNKCR